MDWDDDDETDTIACQHCGRDVYADAERCPHCENYLTEVSDTRTGQPTWVLLTAVLLIALLLYSFIGPLLWI